MPESGKYSKLTDKQVSILIKHGCTAADWSNIFVTEDFDAYLVSNSAFSGVVKIGALSGEVTDALGNEKPSCIYNAVIKNCTIGDNCRIVNIGIHISGYFIGKGVCIENAGTVQACENASFGCGTEVNVLNEAGGRQVTLFEGLTAQFAYLLCLHRYRPQLIEKLNAIAAKCVKSAREKKAVISDGTKISFAREIIDVNIGPSTIIRGASTLINGTILCDPELPTYIGADVNAKDFIIAEYATLDTAAVIEKVYIGQGCKVGKHFSAENSLFFANSELYGGEACSVFAGPYTVTHHKSSLLIAGLLSFFNAGSGANQSNHMYRLGPVHEGKLLRGTKTGSFTYMLWPSLTGPFSAVVGKHAKPFDSSSFPFSKIYNLDEQTYIVPAIQLESSGTLRDGLKWPNRDKRGKNKRDAISFEVMTPYTVSMIIDAYKKLEKMIAEADPASETIPIDAAVIKRTDAERAIELYRKNAEIYLIEKTLDYNTDNTSDANGLYSDYWADIAGLLMPKARLEILWQKIETGEVSSMESFNQEIRAIQQQYGSDQRVWAKEKLKQILNIDADNMTPATIEKLTKRHKELNTEHIEAILADAEKEYSQRSKNGYALDGTENDKNKDFQQVRGLFEDNNFVKDLRENI
jgi:hypothetical protein